MLPGILQRKQSKVFKMLQNQFDTEISIFLQYTLGQYWIIVSFYIIGFCLFQYSFCRTQIMFLKFKIPQSFPYNGKLRIANVQTQLGYEFQIYIFFLMIISPKSAQEMFIQYIWTWWYLFPNKCVGWFQPSDLNHWAAVSSKKDNKHNKKRQIKFKEVFMICRFVFWAQIIKAVRAFEKIQHHLFLFILLACSNSALTEQLVNYADTLYD